ncbi:MAG: ATP-binding protein, partial [Campylobacterota bacterium]|nr:ATP-binding protein [Campylobacterota bacterium]
KIILKDNQSINLAHKESELLKLLVSNKNKCVEFEHIFEYVWGFNKEHNEASLRTYIKNLRKIIGKNKILSIKNKVISLSNGEIKTIKNVLILYLISTFLIISAFSYSYYISQKEQYKKEIENKLFIYSKDIYQELKSLHNRLENSMNYPIYKDFQSTIYDIDKNIIFGEFKNIDINFQEKCYFKNDYNYYIYKTSQYYLGTAYIVIREKGVSYFENILKDMIPILSIIILIIFLTSVFLVQLILKPIRDNLNLLNRFIKDTTHELNTPLSTILANIELIQSKELPYDRLIKRVTRIKSASLTISNLYEDLIYLTLNNKVKIKNENININNIIEQRVEYFSVLFNSKSISISIENKNSSSLFIDKNKIQRVIDNLLSNAIKYSTKNSKIDIIIQRDSFTVCDQGDGMSQKQIDTIHQRYTRFNNTQGGFGIGFNIIYNIVKEYNLNINIKSIIKEGTCVSISW